MTFKNCLARNTVFVTIILCTLLLGCAAHQIVIDPNLHPPTSIIIENVPFIRQKPYYCAPASAEMVLKYHGVNDLDQDAIATSDASNKKGTHWEKLVNYLNWKGKKYDIVADTIYGDLSSLKRYIASGYPVLVRQWTNSSQRSKHYRVVIGYNDKTQKVIYHDPNKRSNMEMDYDTFNALWNIQTERMHWTSKNLMIVIGIIDRKKYITR